jgi:hypothetical protein
VLSNLCRLGSTSHAGLSAFALLHDCQGSVRSVKGVLSTERLARLAIFERLGAAKHVSSSQMLRVHVPTLALELFSYRVDSAPAPCLLSPQLGDGADGTVFQVRTLRHAHVEHRAATWRCCGGCGPTGATGTSRHASVQHMTATWRCCSGRGTTGVTGTRGCAHVQQTTTGGRRSSGCGQWPKQIRKTKMFI